jgi:protein phosphatase PTC1
MKRYVTGDPYTEEHTITEEDTHVILACDGVCRLALLRALVLLAPCVSHVALLCFALLLNDQKIWDVISDQQACDIVLAASSCGEASKELLVTALRSGSTDNISVMVVRI